MKSLCLSFFYLLVILFVNLEHLHAQNTALSAEYRPRTEFRQGFRNPLADTLQPGIVTTQRTRMFMEYKGTMFNAHLSVQDSRIWGNHNLKTNASKIEVYQAWFEYLAGEKLSVQIGRQPLKYDDGRLLHDPAWGLTGMVHDMALAKYKSASLQVHSGLAYNNSKDILYNENYSYGATSIYKAMGIIWVNKKFASGPALSLLGLAEGFEKETDIRIMYPRITYGGYLTYETDSTALGVVASFYLQNGKDINKKYGDGFASLNGMHYTAKVSYKINKLLSPFAGMEYYSGSESDIDASESTSFNNLYGGAHIFNGTMEYFVTKPKQGLFTYYAGLNMKLSPKTKLGITSNFFFFDKDFVYNSTTMNKNIGSEVDILFDFIPTKEVAIQIGYSFFLKNETTSAYFNQANIGSFFPQWAYIMFTVKPTFFKSAPNKPL